MKSYTPKDIWFYKIIVLTLGQLYSNLKVQIHQLYLYECRFLCTFAPTKDKNIRTNRDKKSITRMLIDSY